jgi:hypothetical protein
MLNQHSIKPQKMREAMGRKGEEKIDTRSSSQKVQEAHVREKKDSHQTHWVLSAQ